MSALGTLVDTLLFPVGSLIIAQIVTGRILSSKKDSLVQ